VPISPIAINDNLLDLSITPGPSAGESTSFEFRPTPAGFAVVSDVVTGQPGGIDSIDLSTEFSPSGLRLKGTVPAGWNAPIVHTYQLQPAVAARRFFVQALRDAGVQIAQGDAGTLPARGVVANAPRVATFVSPSFSEYARLINKVSHNLGANMLPLLLAVKAGIERPTLEQGMTLMRDAVARAGVDRAEFTLSDGQGLPPNVASPRGQVQFLCWLAGRPYFEMFRQSTPILGVDGSLKDVLPPGDPARGHVRAKTGTLATSKDGLLLLQTKALAGYIDAKSGRFLAFGIYLNNLPIQGLQDMLDANMMLGKIASTLQQRL